MRAFPATDPGLVERSLVPASETEFLWRVYRWMSIGLALTGGIALFVAHTPALTRAIFSNAMVLFGLIIAELVVVVVFAARASRMTLATAVAPVARAAPAPVAAPLPPDTSSW